MHEPELEVIHQPVKPSSRPSWLVLGIITVLVIVMMVGGMLLVLRHSSGNTDSGKVLAALQNVKDAANYHLYYPANLPSGFTFSDGSLSAQAGIVTYSYSYNGSKLLITEQSRPPIMESVQKIQTFDTSIGHAYIADLNGHTTGFILAGKTLIIVSNANSSMVDQLTQFMKSFRPVG